jgi:hypothetical protein
MEVFSGGRVARHTAEPLLDGELGTLQALRIAAEFVRRDRLDPGLRRWLLENVVGSVRGHDFWAEAQACFEWARDRIVYRRDPFDVERVADMRATLAMGPGGKPEGDCLVKSGFLAGSLAILGNAPVFAVIKQRPEDLTPSVGYRHVYVALSGPHGEEVALDPTPEQASPGWEAPHVARQYFRIFT